MRILLLTSFYPPEIRSISTMMQELAEGLAERGHIVTVITPFPEDNIPDETKNHVFLEITKEKQVRVVRAKTFNGRNPHYVLRGLGELLLPFVYRRAIKKWIREPIEGVIVYIPRFSLASVGAWVRRKYGARYLLNVQDIFPQNAIDAGIIKNPALIAFYECLERRAYSAADALTTHTKGGRDFLIKQKGVPSDKITAVYNWIDPASWVAPNTGRFRKQYGLEGKFIFLFAGILGPTQGLELVIETAKRLTDLPDIHFLFVGEGREKERLVRLVEMYRLNNVMFTPFVSPREYPQLLAEIDVGLMCLAPTNTTAVVPGKLFGYMAAGLPVIAFLHKESEGHRIMKEAQCGLSADSNSPERAEALIRKMYYEQTTLAKYGANGKAYAIEHFHKEKCIHHIEQLIIASCQ